MCSYMLRSTKEIAVVGGVQINRYGADDLFQPLMFETISKKGEWSDLYTSTFGPKPKAELGAILGSAAVATEVLSGRLTKA